MPGEEPACLSCLPEQELVVVQIGQGSASILGTGSEEQTCVVRCQRAGRCCCGIGAWVQTEQVELVWGKIAWRKLSVSGEEFYFIFHEL